MRKWRIEIVLPDDISEDTVAKHAGQMAARIHGDAYIDSIREVR